MTLTLKIRNVAGLDNGMPAEYVLNRRGAVIGRAATCDWSLPDPRNYISSRHCEVTYRDGGYTIADVSTNGTFLNGSTERMAGPRLVAPDDLFLVGHYEIVAELSGEAVAAIERREEQAAADADQRGGWSWDAHGSAPVASQEARWGESPARDAPANSGLASGFGGNAAPLDGGWGTPAVPASDGWGAAPAAPPAASDWGAPPAPPSSDGGWGPAPAAPPPDQAPPAGAGFASAGGWGSPSAPSPSPSAWDSPAAPVPQASAWSSAVSDRPREATPNDIWGSMESSNVVDWARADFGRKAAASADPLGLVPRPAAEALPAARPAAPAADAPVAGAGWGAPGDDATPTPAAAWGDPAPATAPAPQAPGPASPPAAGDLSQAALLLAAAAGLDADRVKQPGAETLERLGGVLRRLVSGLVVMVEARARAKSQMGAEQTGLSFDGNNPIKFARTPEQALAQLLNPTERGFMPAERAIEDAFFDLQSHQMATLRAMQGALKATLDRFSPTAIKARAESGGFMSRLLPGGREATLWHTYEREFSGVAQGSDEAFMDMFAKEFRKAYEEQSRSQRKK